MLPVVFRLRVVILHPRGGERTVTVLPTDRVIDVIARALADAGIEPTAYITWELCLGPDTLPGDRFIRDLIPLGLLNPLTLRPASPTPPTGHAPAPPGTRAAPTAAAPATPQDESEEGDDLDDEDFEDTEFDDDQDAEDEDDSDVGLRDEVSAQPRTRSSGRPDGAAAERMPPPTGARWGAAKAKAGRTESRRATVRYYSRMNPDRVFPLLVMLTREEVEKVVKKHVEQKATGPIKIVADVPLEIEPVLPGCVCHPPRVTTKVGAGDEVFTFHVVPHVLGEVTGARVLLRQDHAPLAEIALDIRVVQRTMVMLSGLSAVALPAASAAMRHFGLDFTPKDGSNPYLAAMNFLFGQVTPLTLTAALLALTGVFWWYTRPKGRDVFWDIHTKPPGSR